MYIPLVFVHVLIVPLRDAIKHYVVNNCLVSDFDFCCGEQSPFHLPNNGDNILKLCKSETRDPTIDFNS